ncbi:hypothetical protein Q9247_09525 [Halomonas meridiana]|uniref:hypothetical protein n=1 Tax=Vreelandella aquamarina TaxID=77097 RepID=UPI00273C8BB9|nr:hypothetical protein [Halomonas meridiana]MDP4557922.1 hypothetical protein [Halomonas meridiana]
MNLDTQQALLRIKGAARAMREEAEAASTKGIQIEPVALNHYAALLDKARDTLEFEQSCSLTNDDTIWLKTVMDSLAGCVKRAEKSGYPISVSEIRAVMSVVNDARVQGGAQ